MRISQKENLELFFEIFVFRPTTNGQIPTLRLNTRILCFVENVQSWMYFHVVCSCLQNIRPTNLATLKDIISSVVVHVVNFDRLSMGHTYQIHVFGVALALRKCYTKNEKQFSFLILILQLFKFASHFASTGPLQSFWNSRLYETVCEVRKRTTL